MSTIYTICILPKYLSLQSVPKCKADYWMKYDMKLFVPAYTIIFINNLDETVESPILKCLCDMIPKPLGNLNWITVLDHWDLIDWNSEVVNKDQILRD